jgi:glutathione S-transferase
LLQVEVAFQDLELLFDEHQDAVTTRPRIVAAWRALLAELGLWETYLSQHAHSAATTCVLTHAIDDARQPTLTDCAFYPALGYLVHHRLDLLRCGFPYLAAYANAMARHPCVRHSQPIGWRNPSPHKHRLLFALLDDMLFD